MSAFRRTAAEDKHFPLPLSSVMLMESTYDPTYGDTGHTTHEFCVCFTCRSLVSYGDIARHAAWHESGPR